MLGQSKVLRLLICATLLLICSGSACAVKVVATVATDCIWYTVPPKLSAANKEHLGRAPDPANAGAFFDVVRDNVAKRREFCPSPTKIP